MIYTLDAKALILWSSTKTDELIHARLEFLLERITKSSGLIIIPTPAIAELLVRTEASTQLWLSQMSRKTYIRIAPFDVKAAAECAQMHLSAEGKGSKRAGTKAGEPYQKIKVDRQIVAIARVYGSHVLVSDDAGLREICSNIGLRTHKVEDLELPDSAKQGKLELDAPEAATVGQTPPLAIAVAEVPDVPTSLPTVSLEQQKPASAG